MATRDCARNRNSRQNE
ncbi:hypothetical protein CEXT_761931, partial [Caerostris extrusa]